MRSETNRHMCERAANVKTDHTHSWKCFVWFIFVRYYKVVSRFTMFSDDVISWSCNISQDYVLMLYKCGWSCCISWVNRDRMENYWIEFYSAVEAPLQTRHSHTTTPRLVRHIIRTHNIRICTLHVQRGWHSDHAMVIRAHYSCSVQTYAGQFNNMIRRVQSYAVTSHTNAAALDMTINDVYHWYDVTDARIRIRRDESKLWIITFNQCLNVEYKRTMHFRLRFSM